MATDDDLFNRWAARMGQAGTPPSAPHNEQAAPIQANPNDSYIGGFLASGISAIPELFGAEPTQRAEAFRQQHPISGFASEMAGFAVPYLGAEAAVAKVPGLAARVGRGVEATMGGLEKIGIRGATQSPMWRGAARELIVNAPLEASRLAVGSMVYPENMDELGWDVAISTGLTGLVGAGAGGLASLGKRLKGKPKVAGVEDFTAAAWQLRALEEGAELIGANADEYLPILEREAIFDNPGKSGVRKEKENKYVRKLENQTDEESNRFNAIWKVGSKQGEQITEEGIVTPEILRTQYFAENPSGATGQANKLQPGELDDLLARMPEGLQTTRDVASKVQYPRIVKIIDREGAEHMGRLANLTGMEKAGKTSYIQEEDGLFPIIHRVREGSGRAYGKGANKFKVGDEVVLGKTYDPGLFEPELKKLSDMVTAPWAYRRTAYQPHQSDNIFSKAGDEYLSIVNKLDAERMAKMTAKQKKNYIAETIGKMKAEGEGLLDQKFNLKDSKVVQDMADQVMLKLAPTAHLKTRNRDYEHGFGLLKNAIQFADGRVNQIVFGKQSVKEGASTFSAQMGTGRKGTEVLNGPHGRHALAQGDAGWDKLNDYEATWIMHMAPTNLLTPARVQKAVKDGEIRQVAADVIEHMRAANEDAIHEIIPVLDESGNAGAEWLKNHLGVPLQPRGDRYLEVKNEAGEVVHVAWGKSNAEVVQEAKLTVAEAKAAGKDWTHGDKSSIRNLEKESEDALSELQRTVARSIGRTPDDGEVIAKAMRRLTAIKSTTGRNPSIPISTGALKPRKSAVAEEALGAKAYTVGELADAAQAHLKQLYRFAAVQNWQSRWGKELSKGLKATNPAMYKDLTQKANEYLGIPGPVTNFLDKQLSNVLSGVGGTRPATKITAAVNNGLYAFTIGFFNTANAILNVLSPIQTVMPWVMHSAVLPRQELADLMGHTVTANGKGQLKGLSAWVEPLKVMGSSIRLLGEPTPELRALMSQAKDDGIIHPQLFEEWFGAGAKNRMTLQEVYKSGGLVPFLGKLSTIMGEETDKFARLIAWNASYRVGKDIAGLEGDALYQFMKRSQELTMFGYHTVDRSNLFTGPVGSMFGLFKNWQMHFIGNMMQYAGLAINKGQFGPLVWAGSSAVAIGGLGATPLIALADGLGNWENQANSSYLYMQDNYSPTMADAAYFGLPAFLGVSLQASATMPGTDVRNEVTSLASFAFWNRAKMLGKAYDAAQQYGDATGMNPMQDPNVRDMFMQATTPRFFIRAMAITEEDYVRSMSTGNPQVRNVSGTGRMLHALGLNAVEIESMQEASQVLYKSEEKMNRTIRGLGRAYYNAISTDDSAEAERVVTTAIGLSVPLDKVARSAMAIQRREEQGDILSRYSLANQMEARTALEQGEDFEE